MEQPQIEDDNLIDMDAYNSKTSGEYSQTIIVDTTKTYYMYEERYANCYNKWGSNIGMIEKDEYGKVTFKDNTVKIIIVISIGMNPYFGPTKRR